MVAQCLKVFRDPEKPLDLDVAAFLVDATIGPPSHFRVENPGPLLVNSDRKLIHQVLRRLLENAVRYSTDRYPIDVNVHEQDGEAIVSITDHGVGISPDRQSFVFEPFHEPVAAGERGYVGIASLGLYLSKQIVHAHGGRIWVSSVPGRGSTFSISLPLAATDKWDG